MLSPMKQSILTLLLLLVTLALHAAGPVKTDCLSTLPQYVRYTSAPGAFCLAADGRAASVLVSSADWEGVVRAAGDLTQDVQRVTGILPRLVQTDEPAPASVLVGTLGKSPLIDRLVEAGKLDASSVSGQWESYLIATVDGCLVIAGSDKRGTIYGIIMGTSHHEPMMRAHKEYTRRRDEVGEWNYATNKTRLDRFFRDGLERNRTYDNLITIGMRGDGDVAMGKGDDEENMQTLAKVVEGQRAIISEVYGRPASEVPQLWPSSPRCSATMTRASPCPTTCSCSSATTTEVISGAWDR